MNNSRLSQLRKILTSKNLDAILISSSPTITYLTNYGNFSATEREAYLLITRLPRPGTGGQAKNKQFVITDGRYSEAVTEKVKHFELIEITIENSLEKIFDSLSKKLKIKRVGIEEKNITVHEHTMLRKHFNDIYHHSDTLDALRVVKDKYEIEVIQKACALGDKAFEYILKKLKIGVSEKEIAFELELFIKKAGIDISFPTIVAFGKNSSIPHHQTNDQRLKTNDIVLLDFGVKIDNYCSDMTRTVIFGSAKQDFKRIYQTVYDAQQKAIDFLYSSRKGASATASRSKFSTSSNNILKASDVNNIAREYILEQGYPSIPHSLGHGIGIEVHEAPSLSPKSKDILKPGMVFSVEPGIYIPGFGGVRIEDLVVLEKSVPRLLTKSNRDLIEV